MKLRVLKALQATNYKNLKMEDGISFDNFNVLVGPNSSGKTNLIKLLLFLKDAIVSPREQQPGISGFDQAIFQLGGTRISDKTTKVLPTKIPITFHVELPNREGFNDVFHIELFVQDSTRKVFINREEFSSSIKHQNNPPFVFYQCHHQTSGKGVVSVFNDESRRKSHLEALDNVPTDDLALIHIPKILENSKFPPENTPIYEIRRVLIDTISQWRFYNANHMNLQQILEAEPKIGQGDRFLSASGENLALVLYNLMSDSLDFEEQFNEAIKLILPTTRRLRAIPAGRLSLTLEWYLENTKEPFYLSEMSDGTVRMLCWATILHSPLLPSLLVIEEPEIGIHVAWLKVLAEWIKQASQKTQIIISTHSPDLLDYFTDEADKVLVFNATGPDKSHFEVKHLSQEAIASWVQEGWQLGDLYRVGDPSVGGWPW